MKLPAESGREGDSGRIAVPLRNIRVSTGTSRGVALSRLPGSRIYASLAMEEVRGIGLPIPVGSFESLPRFAWLGVTAAAAVLELYTRV